MTTRWAAMAGVAACVLAAQGVRADVVAHWSFDKPDDAGVYADTANNAHPATPQTKGAVQVYSGSDPTKFGGAVTFTGAQGSYLTIPALTTFQNKPFTVASWVNVPVTGQNYFLTDWPSYKANGFEFGFEPKTRGDKARAEPYFELCSAETSADTNKYHLPVFRAPSNKAFPLNEWHHLAFVWDRDSQSAISYLDGAVLATQKKQSGTGYATSLDGIVNNRPMRIGSREMAVSGQTGPAMFNGSLDELWIFDVALKRDQIQTLMRTNALDGMQVAVADTPAPPADNPPPVTPTPPRTNTRPPRTSTAGPAQIAPPETPATTLTPPASMSDMTKPLPPAVRPPARGLSAGRAFGVVACAAWAILMSGYLFWATKERARLRAIGKM